MARDRRPVPCGGGPGSTVRRVPVPPSGGGRRRPLTRHEFGRAAGVSRETLERLDAYVRLLAKWQPRLNLVSRTSMADVWRRHVLDSAQLFPHVPSACQHLVDLGSGAGFPGLVLAILGVRGVELIESDGRKCGFLAAAAAETGAKVTIRNARIEALPNLAADVVTARGCAPLPKLLAYAERFVAAKTVVLFLKGARVDEELTNAARHWRMGVSRFPSRTERSGTILRIQELARE